MTTLQDMRYIFSAKIVFSRGAKIVILSIIFLILTSFIFKTKESIYITVLIVNCIYLFMNSYRMSMFCCGLRIFEYSSRLDSEMTILEDKLPSYTIMIALYHEAVVVPYLVAAMMALDYPKDRLQIILLTEEDDDKTIQAIREIALPSYFELEIVPQSEIKTKPNALNWGLAKARGEIITIYDAEDRPNSDQLKKVVEKFNKSTDEVVCIQARLNFYNAEENILTKLFAFEYATLFNYVLPAMTIKGNPIPLGGTSNHFKTQKLLELGGWDAYNVTEDADLGLRLAAAGYRTRMVYSFTPEEATISVRAWLKQRTRWFKGYIHTYFVYMRRPLYIIKKYKWSGFVFFNHTLFLSPFMLIIMPFMLYFAIMVTMQYYCYEPLSAAILQYFTWINILFGYLSLAFTSYIISLAEERKTCKIWCIYPFYFVLHIIAAMLAMYKLLVEPHKWDKTTHGVSKFKEIV